MSVLRGERTLLISRVGSSICLGLICITFSLLGAASSRAQSSAPNSPAEEHVHPEVPVFLGQLLNEAEQNNPQIRAARQGWDAAKQVPSQVSTLPDPQFLLQQVNVGSPRPFAGYTNSDFAYIGLGVSQDLPYPGKLKLRGEMAKRDANVSQERFESVRRSVLRGVKTAYFELAYLSETLGILESDGQLLDQMEKAADVRYRSGMGSQQDILEAQIEKTKLLREVAMHHLEVAKAQAQIKQFLSRPQSSPDIETADLAETPLPYTFDELLAAANIENPDISGMKQTVEKQKLQVDLAHKDFDPDFNIQYMWQRTDPAQFRAYYMLTIGVKVPIYRSRKQRPELAQTEAELAQSQSRAQSQAQQVAFQVRMAFDTAQKTTELLKIYRDGLLPQSRAEFQSGLAAYQNNRQDFNPLLKSFLDVLQLDVEYWENLAERETALAQLEELTGLSLRDEGTQP